MGIDVLEQSQTVAFAAQSVEATIGNTPLLHLQHFDRNLPHGVRIYAKAEHLNPGGSVKDRAALSMILDGERSGRLRPGMTILDATSGNTGISYAMIGAARGYSVSVCLPANAGFERKKILENYGVEIIETDPLLSTDGAQLIARELFESDPQKYFYPDQYNNDANWRAHYEGTANEIWLQTQMQVSHFVTGLGTSGTFVGTVRRLKELRSSLRAISVQPDSPLHGLEGLKDMATAMLPGIYDPLLADDNFLITTDDACRMSHQLARKEGIFVGPSSGANVYAARRVAMSAEAPACIVTILCDRGDKYLQHSLLCDD
ncbi:MAG: PLP-dependent cysteine synthase family protein [Pyrinomonadaceae bacterium]